MFRQNFTCFALLKNIKNFYCYRAITYYGQTFQTVCILIKILLG